VLQTEKYFKMRSAAKTVSSTSPIQLNMAYSISWCGAETGTKAFKMAAKKKKKQRSLQCEINSER
jgi:hypothetical protein